MSRTVTINYEQIAIQCESICEVARRQLEELDNMLAELEQNSSRILNEQSEELKRQIEREKSSILEKIEKLLMKADADAKKGTVKVENHSKEYKERNVVIDEANALLSYTNQFAANTLPSMRALLETLLADSIAANQARMIDRAKGIVTVDTRTMEFLNSIDDEIMRQFAYIAYIRDSSLSGAALLEAGKALMSESVEARYKREAELIRAELAAAKVPVETAEKIVGSGKPLSEIRETATTEIVGEKVRYKTIKIIMKAILNRGFIVDKKNIKINRETNEVTLVALKASGERATFRVFLDGKFIYDFRGYEGQACQNDIAPFMEDLEEVYGVRITSSEVTWSNPDKNSTMKYNAMNTNKNKR